MTKCVSLTVAAISAAIAFGTMALAQTPPSTQTPNYPVRNVNYDLWCQESLRYPAERCDQRRPEDIKAFEDYLAKIGPYELEYWKTKVKEREFEQTLNSDSSSPNAKAATPGDPLKPQ